MLINLANGLHLGVDVSGTKQQIGRQIAELLGGSWTSRCESVGQTITLFGLNLLLELAVDRLSWSPSARSDDALGDVADEARKIVELVADAVPLHWEGKRCIQEMRNAGSVNWRQTEWPGWYLEFRALPVLVNTLGGGPIKYLNTKFDYSLNRVWDLKAHSVERRRSGWSFGQAQLNDQEAMQQAASDRGLGLIILSGEPDFSDGQFTDWHRSLRGKPGQSRRALKSGFTPKKLDVFYIPDLGALQRAVGRGQLVEFRQGHQPSGEPRRPKFSLNVGKSVGTELQVFEHTFKSSAS